MENHDLRPISVAATVLAGLLGPKLAVIASAYGIILIGWFAGLLIGFWRFDEVSKRFMLGYTIVTMIVAVGSTVALSSWLAQYVPIEASGLYMIVAGSIPAIGPNWPQVWEWVAKRGPWARKEMTDGS